jgi:hypothetical protein
VKYLALGIALALSIPNEPARFRYPMFSDGTLTLVTRHRRARRVSFVLRVLNPPLTKGALPWQRPEAGAYWPSADCSWRELMLALRKILLGPAALGAALLLALTASATAQVSPSPRDKLAVWAGHWERHGEVKETQFGHARTFDYDVQCSFLVHGDYMACSALSAMPDPNHGNRIADVARLFYYSDVDKIFKYTEVSPEGGPREGIALVDGNVWTEPVEVPRPGGGTADGRFVFNFVSNKILAQFEVSLDKGAHWTVVDEFIDTKEDQ